MKRTREIQLGFDDRSFESLDKMAKQGRFGKDCQRVEEITVTNPETNESRVLIAPVDESRATHAPLFREDISNPWRHIPDAELLHLAGVIDLRDNHWIEELPNGRIKIHPIDESKRY